VSDSNSRRRHVLQALSAAGLTALVGCGGDGDTTNSTPPTNGGETTAGTAAGTRQTDSTPDDGDAAVDRSLVADIERVAVPFETAGPTASPGDLGRVAADFADARIVGLGEATHGTREFQTARARLVRALVTDAGFRAVAFEDNFGGLQRVDEFVTDGEGTLDDAMDGFHGYLFDTETVRELIGWLRSFNEGRPRDDRVGVYGIDVQNAALPAGRVRSYLARVDPGYLETTASDPLTRVAGWPVEQMSYGSAEVERLFGLVETLRTRLEGHRAEYVAASSRDDWELAMRSVRAVEESAERGEAQQAGDSARERLMAGYEVREETMAENAAWIAEFAPGDGLALWAHNSHVQRGRIDRGLDDETSKTMGEFVADHVGADYRVIVLTFGRGAFTAEDSGGVGTFSAENPVSGSLAEVLVEVDHPAFYLDTDAGPGDSDIATWLDDTQRIHRVGSAWGGELETVRIRPRTDADGLLFVRETTATTPLLADRED